MITFIGHMPVRVIYYVVYVSSDKQVHRLSTDSQRIANLLEATLWDSASVLFVMQYSELRLSVPI